ncbi:hypothetical protein BDY21DRAFT_324005 [Lineolata rhizophorae]|uniref:Mmc1 C-terminal domain-containing protein n=1 Tax=Lineolata rhizophorae TaxID=578093 RepID=A0A6A6NUT8_9PEZI|nr:hypothetical protein BDY21DRAFT_324005 [Lineolata rhizophorae]
MRYGEEPVLGASSAMQYWTPVRSRILRKHNIELVVANVGVDARGRAASSSAKDTVLEPFVLTKGSSMPVNHPVHRAIVLGKGMEGAVAYGRFMDREAEKLLPPGMVKPAVVLSTRPGKASQDGEQLSASSIATVDLDAAEKGLAAFRESVSNATIYEENWLRSGLPALSEWLEQSGTLSPRSGLKPPLEDLITAILRDAEASVEAEEKRLAQMMNTPAIAKEKQQSILSDLAGWAESAHTELRDKLDLAFAGSHWRKLAWWKLFWRADDVAMVCEDVLERRWLVDAEKDVVFIAGRMQEAGFFKPEAYRVAALAFNVDIPGVDKPAPNAVMSAPDDADGRPLLPQTRPWPLQIPLARSHLSASSIPPLQALAQRLVLETLSTSGLTAALSALMYISLAPGVSLLEAGAVGALGLTWSLRRMQRVWEGARERWGEEVREEGRRAIKDAEERVARVVKVEGGPPWDDAAREELRRAREAVERARTVWNEVLEGKEMERE